MYTQSAIKGSKEYYDYLTDNQKGLIENKVKAIYKNGLNFELKLYFALKNFEDAQIRIHNKIYTEAQIKPISYCEDTLTLTVKPLDIKEFENIKPNDVTVISDLRFLVKRIELWYTKYGDLIKLPSIKPNILLSEDISLALKPSQEQKNVIDAVLSNPFVYVWGAPGTGKTQFVLARCILAYINSNKRVIITAPTNQAVEQILYGVIPVLNEAGISLKCLLRLGVPSKEFSDKYPDICEDFRLAKEHEIISQKLLSLEWEIQKNKEYINLYPAYQNYIDFEKSQDIWEREHKRLLTELKSAFNENYKLESEYGVLRGEKILLNDKEENLNSQKEILQVKIKHYSDKAEKYNKGLRKLILSVKKQEYIKSLQESMYSLDEIKTKLKEIKDFKILYNQKEKVLADKLSISAQNILNIKNKISNVSKYWNKLYKITQNLTYHNLEMKIKELNIVTIEGRELLFRKKDKYKALEGITKQILFEKQEYLNREYAECIEKKKRLEKRTSNPINNCLVLAATVDTLLNRISPNNTFNINHIFLDEAGYCSIIKATALLAYNCPVTFLGDHMQLPPICEMSDDEIRDNNKPCVSLWAQSALYSEDIFEQNIEKICETYLTHKNATFLKLKKCNLTYTYRFDNKLAKILADTVYLEKFCGNINHSTDIFFIDSGKRSKADKKRVSNSECQAIYNYVKNHNNEDIGIITPYKAQKEAILKEFSQTKQRDNVLTVHGSQGREWNTVLISVVDTTDKWFTDSQRIESNGKCVINTAVSRAKRKLILVCDAEYWKTQNNQLIGKLLSIADEFK